MAQPRLQIRRHTEAEIQQMTLLDGEVALATDTKNLWIGWGGTNYKIGTGLSASSELSDFNLASLQVGDHLHWDGSDFVNERDVITRKLGAGGEGSLIGTGIMGWLYIDGACEITDCIALCYPAATFQVDIWKDTYANFPPTDGDSITAGAELSGANVVKAKADVSTWSRSLLADDTITVNLDSNDAATSMVIFLVTERRGD